MVRRFTLGDQIYQSVSGGFLPFPGQCARHYWPQMMILMVLTDLDRDKGVPVNVVAKLTPFITTQSKLLEKNMFLRRRPCTRDARVVQLSLTDNACKRLADIAAQQEEPEQFVVGELSIQELAKLARRLSGLRHRLERARLKAARDS